MTYVFDPISYHPALCADCGQEVPMDIETPAVSVPVAGVSRYVPGLYRCWGCAMAVYNGLLVSQVTPESAYAYLTNVVLPATANAIERAQIAASEGEIAAQLVHDMDEERDGDDDAGLNVVLDMRREADGTVTYRCPNPHCPTKRHNVAEVADTLPVELLERFMAAMPD